jgi:predicted PolB exonuclease-like 3'-5' exonuclease
MTRKRLYFDLELSKALFWAWGTGKQFLSADQLIEPQKIISLHWSWEDEEEVHNMDWGLDKQCDKAIVKKIIKLFDQADEIVAHNGRKFDLKKVYGRAMFHNVKMASDYHHKMLDTMLMVKSVAYLPSYSLKFCCKHFNLPLKLSSGGSETWDLVQFHKDQKALDHLLHYGDGDIVSMKALFHYIRPYTKHKTHYAVLRGDEKFNCPECGKLSHYKQMRTTAAGTIQHRMQCSDRKGCRTQFTINNKTYMDFLKFKMRYNIK